MLIIKNIDLEKKKENLSYKKCFCGSSLHVLLYLSLIPSLDKSGQRVELWYSETNNVLDLQR
jgi:hypothetical protein